MIRVTVYNEFLHEKTDDNVKAIYPEGIHNALKEHLTDDEITVKTVTLDNVEDITCLLYTSPSPRDGLQSRMPSSA